MSGILLHTHFLVILHNLDEELRLFSKSEIYTEQLYKIPRALNDKYLQTLEKQEQLLCGPQRFSHFPILALRGKSIC